MKVRYLEHPFEDKVFALGMVKMKQFLLSVEFLEIGVDGEVIIIVPLLEVLFKRVDV